MLSGEGNENGRKTTTGLISKKSNFARAAHFFCTFLCLCFSRLQRGTSRNFLVTRFMEEMLLSLIFTPVAANNSHFLTTATRFHVVPTTEEGLLCFFLSRSSSFSRSASLGVALLSLFFVFLFLCIPNLWT